MTHIGTWCKVSTKPKKNYIEIINLYNSSYELMKERYTELSKFVEKYAYQN